MKKPVEINRVTGSAKETTISVEEDGYIRSYGGMIDFGRKYGNNRRDELAVSISDVKAFLEKLAEKEANGDD